MCEVEKDLVPDACTYASLLLIDSDKPVTV